MAVFPLRCGCISEFSCTDDCVPSSVWMCFSVLLCTWRSLRCGCIKECSCTDDHVPSSAWMCFSAFLCTWRCSHCTWPSPPRCGTPPSSSCWTQWWERIYALQLKRHKHTNKLGEDRKYTQTNFHDISYSKSCLFLHEVSWACLNFKLLKQTTLKHSNPLFYWNLNSINTRYILIFSSWQAAIWRIYLVYQESCTRCIPTVMWDVGM
jgi:hypothetical protein